MTERTTEEITAELLAVLKDRDAEIAVLELEIKRLKVAQAAERVGSESRAYLISITPGQITVTDPAGDDARAGYLLGVAAGMHDHFFADSPFANPRRT